MWWLVGVSSPQALKQSCICRLAYTVVLQLRFLFGGV